MRRFYEIVVRMLNLIRVLYGLKFSHLFDRKLLLWDMTIRHEHDMLIRYQIVRKFIADYLPVLEGFFRGADAERAPSPELLRFLLSRIQRIHFVRTERCHSYTDTLKSLPMP